MPRASLCREMNTPLTAEVFFVYFQLSQTSGQ